MYDKESVIEYCREEDVKFIRLAFTDVYGEQKNISIMPHELERAFSYGISIDALAIDGFAMGKRSDLFLFPNPATLTLLPWRPLSGKVVRMYCDVKNPDGTPFVNDTRQILKKACDFAAKEGIEFKFGSEIEFYLFKTTEDGEPTKIPYDNAGYMDIAPKDKGENVRREICLTLEEMNLVPEGSHHEEGPGQNEIDYMYSDPLCAADDATTFKGVVRTVAERNGLYASFEPKPLEGRPGNGFHINFSLSKNKKSLNEAGTAGVLKHIKEITAFLNCKDDSYNRLGKMHAPKYISYGEENRTVLIRIPAAKDIYKRSELRSADSSCNPYIAFALIIYAALDGVKNNLTLPKELDANDEKNNQFEVLPLSLDEAKTIARTSDFIKEYLPKEIFEYYLK